MIIHKSETLMHAPAFGWDHGKGDTYMDRKERIEVILDALQQNDLDELLVPPREFDMQPIRDVHSPDLVNFIRSSEELEPDQAVYPYVFPYRKDICSPRTNLHEAVYYCFDVGTVMHRGTFPAAKAAVDTALEGATRIREEKQGWAFALCRPPGHHSDRDFYGGLCFFNNAAIAARYLSAQGRTAILDLDFHHGNGTQGIFYYDPEVLYVSIHGDTRRHFPFMTGHPDEIGAGPGEGLTYNLPLPADVDFDRYRSYLDRAFKRIHAFSPQYLVVSMGFDAFYTEILGDAVFQTRDYTLLARELRALDYPLLICLEGGYDLDALGTNVVHFVSGVLE
ncbi:histone deacetylase family protein [candidate division KSB1 bacterium]|nr:histone deacetylase family protein [candidate division KSB1 bacterium]